MNKGAPDRILAVVKELIGTHELLAVYRGQYIQLSAFPDNAGFGVDEVVVATRLPYSTQYWTKYHPQGLYLAPGGQDNWWEDHYGQGMIYKLVGDVWQLLATFGRDANLDPDGFSDAGYVSCMFWDATLKKLYAIPWYQDWVDDWAAPNPQPYDLYEVNTQTGVVTGLGHSAVMRPVDEFPGYWSNPLCYCQQAAKFGNYWFITGVRQEEYVAWPGFYYERAVLYKFDPVANTMVMIDAEPIDHETSTYNPGVATDGTTLYWWFIDDDAANYIVYRRTVDGINFVTDEEHANRTRWPYAEMKYNPANGRFQVAGYGSTFPPLVQFGKLLYRNPAGSWVVDQAPGIAGDPYFVGSVGFRYVGNVCTYEYILAYAEAMAFWPPANRQRVYSRAANSTGAFVEENVAGLQGGYPVNNAFASLSGRIYCFKGQQVFYRDGDVGAWIASQVFTEWLWSGGPLVHGFCIATSRPISET